MKKKLFFIAVLIVLTFLTVFPALASTDWDTFVLEMAKRGNIKETGEEILNEMRNIAPSGTEEELWNKLWHGDMRLRAASAVALIDRMFPNGDPSKWEEIRGFVPGHSVLPRQLLAMDALFVAVSTMKQIPDGVWGSAYLLDVFGKSGLGKVKFIDEVPAEIRQVLDEIISETGLPGDWSSKRIRGRIPMLPVYRGYITRDAVDSRNMQYIDGYGSLSGNGRYAWDRDRGYLYEVVDGSRDLWIYDK